MSSTLPSIEDCSICQSFWNDASSMISETEKHEFLVSMVDGTLKDENFQYYVIQDALYLKDFADCLHRLSKNDGISAEDSKRLEEFAIGASEAEMSLHNSFFKEWNIQANAEHATSMPNTLLYTSNMIRVVTTRSHAEGLASLLPCFWVYMHVGEKMLELRKELGDSVSRPKQFDAWIDMYGGEDFAKEVRDYIRMTENAAKEASAEEVERMRGKISNLNTMMFLSQFSTTQFPFSS